MDPYQPNDPSSPQTPPQPINQQPSNAQQTPVNGPGTNQPQVFTPNMAIPENPSLNPVQPQDYNQSQYSVGPNPAQSQFYNQPQQYAATPPTQPSSGSGNTPAGYEQFLNTPLPNPDAKRRKIGLIIIALVVLIIIGGGFLLASKGNNPVSDIANSIGGSGEVVDRSDGTLDLSNLTDTQKTIKNQDLKAKLNQQINLSNGMSYMATGVERNFVANSEFLKAADGKELIKVDLVVGNKDKQNSLYVYYGFFSIKNSAGGLQKPLYADERDITEPLISGELASGKQIKGAIVFEVDKDEQIDFLITEDKYENYSTKDQVELKSEVSLK